LLLREIISPYSCHSPYQMGKGGLAQMRNFACVWGHDRPGNIAPQMTGIVQ